MAPGVDRSKFRNPDMPIGYVKPKPKLVYRDEGIDIDGQHYIFAKIVHEMNMKGRPDYERFKGLDFLSDSDEEILLEQEEESNTVPSCDTQNEKEVTVAKKESDESVTADKKLKHGKKDQEKNIASNLDDFLSKMEIEKPEKKRKAEKSSKDSRDNDSSPSKRKDRSPSCHRRQSDRHSLTDPHGKIVTYSSSPSPERYDMQVKLEPLEEPQHLFGCYRCDVCNITMNSELTFETHMIGKRHLKNMKMKNIPEAIAQSVPPPLAVSEGDSKYPHPSPGVIRRKVHMPAGMQPRVESFLRNTPCPGLYLVIEIRELSQTVYYCTICDCLCSSDSLISHLKGFKHQLNSVKHFKPSVYEDLQHEPKYKIEKEVQRVLRAVQKKEGMGRMLVEVDELPSKSQDIQSYSHKQSILGDYPSTSRGISKNQVDLSFTAKYHQASVPNKSASDFFCETCQSHMNSIQMWESHVRGKRHLTNLKKNPGDLPSKTKTVPVKRRAVILDRIKRECPDEPIVGLKEVRETEIMETQSHSYQCFLCGSCHTSLDIIDHLKSLKHRIKYLDHIKFPGREVIAGMSDLAAHSLVKDMCYQVEANEGPGKPAVHVNKNALYR